MNNAQGFSSLEEMDRNLSSIFVGAANQLTTLFKTSKLQNRQAFSMGYHNAINHITEFLLKRDQSVGLPVSMLLDLMKDLLRRNDNECSQFEAESHHHHHSSSSSSSTGATNPTAASNAINQTSTPNATPPTTPHILSPSFSVQPQPQPLPQQAQSQSQQQQQHQIHQQQQQQAHQLQQLQQQHQIHQQQQPQPQQQPHQPFSADSSCTISSSTFTNNFSPSPSSSIFFGNSNPPLFGLSSAAAIGTDPNGTLTQGGRKREVEQIYPTDSRMIDENHDRNTYPHHYQQSNHNTMEFTYGDQRIWKKTKSDY